MIYLEGDFQGICAALHHKLMDAIPVDTGHWQSLKNVPHTATRELLNVCIATLIPQDRVDASLWVQPNLPWAEDHFQERVGGVPTNPGEQYMNWPWYDPSWKAQKQREFDPDMDPQGTPGHDFNRAPAKFSHTYQERVWPRKAFNRGFGTLPDDIEPISDMNKGIRFRYGDLNDVVNLLAREPTTRQAYLPIWFPEDTGAHHGERVPCTLGYHFMLRGGLLHITYFIRSCDFLRYFRDDVYMAMRLGQWMLEQLKPVFDTNDSSDSEIVKMQHPWYDVEMGILHMHMVSLHIFEGDMGKMRREAPAIP